MTDKSTNNNSKHSILADFSVLTSLPETLTNKLLATFTSAIVENVLEDHLEDSNISILDIGIGDLYIKHEEGEEVKFKFIPSDFLRSQIDETVKKRLNSMENTLNEKLKQKLLDVYKDLC